MEILTLIDPEIEEKEENLQSLGFVKIRSELLDGEIIVLVFSKESVKKAKEDCPGCVLYTPKEIRELRELAPDEVKLMHFAKKEFGGGIYPGTKIV